MLKYLLMTAAGVMAISYWQGSAPVSGAGEGLAAFRYQRGTTVSLSRAGGVLLTGAGLKNGVMEVFCGRGGFAFGFYKGDVIGLNGFSSALSRQGEVELGAGGRRAILSTERPDLIRAGAIEPDADPLVYNRRMDEGLKLAQEKCPG
ncbi:MAG: hypothetical protein DI537_08615 [Stutzerimonas stutzeri]|nr:MAG: hypothetical protein DI537_08615 [Stutzerimonas stutzeri]